MGRYGRRISRSLIGVLIVTLVLGLAFYLKNTKSTQAAQEQAPAKPLAQAPAPKPAAPAAAPAPKPATQPVVTATPTVPSNPATPSTQPAQFAAAVTMTPTTAPAATPLASSAAPTTRSTNSAWRTNPPAPSGDSIANPIAAGQAKKDAGDVLAARTILNDALLSGKLSPADTETAKKTIAEINQTVVFSPKRFADDPFGGTYSVQSGDLLQKIATKFDITWEALGRLNGISDPKKLRAGQTIKVIHGPFNAVVSKSKFMMDIYLGPPLEKGSMYVTSYPVGLGKDDSTPTGAWLVEAGKKIKNPTYYSPRGEGIIDADDPKNPLGERWVGLTGIDGHAVGKASYGIHGTIDESSIGKMESMGCIRMHNADVEWVFDLMVEGKSIVLVKD
jgi:LysM repeat protein